MRTALSLAFWSYMGLSCAVLWVVAVLIWATTLPFDRRRALLHRYTCWWGYHYVQLNPFWNCEIEGRERIPAGPAVLVANHQSAGDILVLFGLKRHFKWVSKAVVFKVPFIGWNMRMNDYVRLLRGDRRSIVAMLRECKKHLRNGSAIILFPEGTRSLDGEIKTFKHGAFSIAAKERVPVVPIILDGTIDALPKSGWVFRNGRRLQLRVRVLDPILPGSGAAEDPDGLREHVRATMIEELGGLRQQRLASVAPISSDTHPPELPPE